MRRLCIHLVLLLLLPAALLAEPAMITVEQTECVPLDGNGIITARVENEPPASSVRIHFRRLNAATEDFYYVIASPVGDGLYRAVLPQAEDRDFEAPGEPENWSTWWFEHDASEERGERSQRGMFERRDWLYDLDEAVFQEWLLGLDNEPVEYFASLVDVTGSVLARSDMRVARVGRDCTVMLTDREHGTAENLTIGETAEWQAVEEIHHWLCSGIVTRIDPLGIPKADPFCREAFPSRWPGEEDAGSRYVPTAGGEQTFKTVQIFYGTDRRREFDTSWSHEGDTELAYGSGRGSLEVGTCDVSIPFDHEEGALEAPGILQKADPAKHVLLLSVDRRSRQVFVDELKNRIGRSEGKEAVVFVHGYNVSFEDAARRTAQMSHDLEFDGAPIMYSWPSHARIQSYAMDEANVRWTVPNLVEFLRLVVRESEADSIHVVAHSMGNRALTEALRRFALEEPQVDQPLFDEIALVAPDVDTDVFQQEIVPAIRTVGKRLTLYASSRDKALQISSGVHGHPRAGDLSESIVLVEGLETVDASDVDTSLLRAISLGHSYFADKPTVLFDLGSVLAGIEAVRRETLVGARRATANYWKILPGH